MFSLFQVTHSWPACRLLVCLVCIIVCWQPCEALQCWLCIGPTCDQDPANDRRARHVTCTEEEAVCMKVEHVVKINGDLVAMVTRTCSVPKVCEEAEDMEECQERSAMFRDGRGGCSKKTCCRDSDFCNHAGPVSTVSFTVCFSLMAAAWALV